MRSSVIVLAEFCCFCKGHYKERKGKEKGCVGHVKGIRLVLFAVWHKHPYQV